MHILLIEDERPVAQAVIRLLSEGGYQVEWRRNGAEGLAAAEAKPYDLVILDILLPVMNGWDVCRELRAKRINTPLLILSAMDEPGDVARGLDLGADDYLCKPFEPSELLARVRARLRAGQVNLGRRIEVSDLEIDRVERTVRRGGQPISLTYSEYVVLERLAAHAGREVAAGVLAREVGLAFDPLADPVALCVGSLRRKLDRSPSQTLIHQTPDGFMLDARPVLVGLG